MLLGVSKGKGVSSKVKNKFYKFGIVVTTRSLYKINIEQYNAKS